MSGVTRKIALLVPISPLLRAPRKAQLFRGRAVLVPRAYFYAPFYDPFWRYDLVLPGAAYPTG